MTEQPTDPILNLPKDYHGDALYLLAEAISACRRGHFASAEDAVKDALLLLIVINTKRRATRENTV